MIVEDRYIPSTEAVKFIAKAKDKYGGSECYKCKYIEEINI